jgi:hypothetical protein
MAGHFVLKSITVSDLYAAIQQGCTWSGLAHQGGTARPIPPGGNFPGWNQVGRQALTDALSGAGILNRNDLPPHRYLQFGPIQAGPIQAGPGLYDYIRGAGWAENVVRPDMGLRLLSPLASNAWTNNNFSDAVFLQAQHGATSVEIYYIAGTQMG